MNLCLTVFKKRLDSRFVFVYDKGTLNKYPLKKGNVMNLQHLVKSKVGAAYAACGLNTEKTLVKTSDRPDISDYQSNGALGLAKELKTNPRILAEQIATQLRQDDFFDTVTVDGPGFINMRLSTRALTENAFNILATDTGGYERPTPVKKIVIDYGGPNIAKALHVGHLRPHVIGEAIKRLCRFAGDEVIGDIHLGDWGLPMGLLMAEIQERQPDLPYFNTAFSGSYPDIPPFTAKDLEVMYPLASQKSKQDAAYLARAKELTRRLQAGDKGLKALWQQFIDVSVTELKKLYHELDIQFDLWRGESHVNDRLKALIERLKADGTLILDDGAQIIPLGKAKGGNDLPPLIMVKSDGAVMYGATDLATIEERVTEFNPDEILYVVDARQGLHFEQVFSAADKLGLLHKAKPTHLGFGTINGRDNKPFKTRDGGVMTLRMLIDIANKAALDKMNAGEMGRDLSESEKENISKIVGTSALKFADLMNERTKNYIFDPDKLTSVEGKTGPYLLYAMVRMKSLLEKNGATDVLSSDDIPTACAPAERALLLRLYALPDSVQTAYDNKTPHVICDYLFKLAQDFNLFYHDCPIKDTDPTTKHGRLALTKYTLHIARLMAHILGLHIPPKM